MFLIACITKFVGKLSHKRKGFEILKSTTGNELITKSNQLIQGTITTMDVKELKLMAVLLAEFHNAYRGNDMCTQTIINRREFLSFLGINASGENYIRMDAILKHFQQRAICEWIDGRGGENITPFFKNIRFHREETDGDNNIVFTWNDCIIPLVVGLDKNFTKMFKRNILALSSKRAIILYELMKSYMERNFPIKITIEDLRKRLNLLTGYYNSSKYVLKKLEETTKEVNQSTDIIVNYVKNKNPKDKRKVESLTFTVKDQAERKVWWEEFPEIKLSDEQYQRVKTWVEPVHFKTLLAQMQQLMDKGRHMRNQYKWLCTQHDKLLKKSNKIEAKPEKKKTNKRLKKPKEKIILTDEELRELRFLLSLRKKIS